MQNIICAGFFPDRHDTLYRELKKSYTPWLFSPARERADGNAFTVRQHPITDAKINGFVNKYFSFIKRFEKKFNLQLAQNDTGNVVKLISTHMLQAYNIEKSLEDFQREQGCAAVIAVNDHLASIRALVLAAKKRAIPTVFIEHGYTGSYYPFESLKNPEKMLVFPKCDHLCVDSQLTKTVLESMCKHYNLFPQIHVTGTPLDHNISKKEVSPPPQGANPVSKLVFCSGWNEANMMTEICLGNLYEYRAFHRFCRMVGKLKKIFPKKAFVIAVKPHPTLTVSLGLDMDSFYSETAAQYGLSNSNIVGEPLQDVLATADLLVNSKTGSTSTDAFLSEVPCLTDTTHARAKIKEAHLKAPTKLCEWGVCKAVYDDSDWAHEAKALLEAKWDGRFSRLCKTHKSQLSYITPKEASRNILAVLNSLTRPRPQTATGTPSGRPLKNFGVVNLDEETAKLSHRNESHKIKQQGEEHKMNQSNSYMPPGFFVSGPERGGTTVMGTLLSAHPDVFVVLSSIVFTRFHNFFLELVNSKNYSPLLEDICKDLPLSSEADLIGDERPVHPLLVRWYLNLVYRTYITPPRSFDINKDSLYTIRHAEILDMAEVLLRARDGKHNWRQIITSLLNELVPQEYRGTFRLLGEQTPDNALHNKIINAIFPQSKFVFIFRNPFSNIASIYRRRKSDGFNHAIDIYLHPFIKLQENFQAMHDRVFYVQLESLIENRDKVLKKIFAFLEIADVEISENYHSYLTPKYVGTKLKSDRHRESQKVLTSEQKKEILRRCNPIIENFYSKLAHADNW